MIHPSYKELIDKINQDTPADEEPLVTSRYSIVLATSKRARQIVGGDDPMVRYEKGKKALSIAVEELYEGKINILPDTDEEPEETAEITDQTAEEITDAAEETVETEEE